jgi:hypothetical protein
MSGTSKTLESYDSDRSEKTNTLRLAGNVTIVP